MPELNDTKMFENLNLTQTYVREIIRAELGFNQVVKVELINKNLNIYLKNGQSFIIPMEEPFINEYSSALMSLVGNLNSNNIVNAYVNSEGLLTVTLDNGLKITSDFSYLNESILNITGDLKDLNTEVKTSVVTSINEIINKIDYEVSQKQINDGLKSIAQLIAVKNPRNGQRVYVKSYHAGLNKGGGTFVYDSTKATINDGGIVVNGWVRQVENNVVTPSMFGAKADGTTDDRAAIQSAIDNLWNRGGGVLFYESGTYLVDSGLGMYYHGELLQLRSNVTHLSYDAVIKVGASFDDKLFVLFNGFDNTDVTKSSILTNVRFDGLTFDFSGDVSQMRTSYKRRVGIQTGLVVGGYVKNCVFKNGDIHNAVIVGWMQTGDNFTVSDCEFTNLVQESVNNRDYTAVYLCAKNSKVTNCKFYETSKIAYEVACAVELHASNSQFTDSFVKGFTKACFLVSTTSENKIVTDLQVTGITSITANSLAFLWSDVGCSLSRVTISNNYFKSYQFEGTHIDVHGYRGLITAYKTVAGGDYADVWVKDNVILIENSANPTTATGIYSTVKINGLYVDNNIFNGCIDGIVLDVGQDSLNEIKITNNKFSAVAPTALLNIHCNVLDGLVVAGNIASYYGTYDTPINITSDIKNSHIGLIDFTNGKPTTRDFVYSASFLTNSGNTAKFKLYGRPTTIHALNALSTGVMDVNIPTDCVKAQTTYEYLGIMPSQHVIASQTISSSNPIHFIVYNKEGYTTGEDTRLSTILVDLK